MWKGKWKKCCWINRILVEKVMSLRVCNLEFLTIFLKILRYKILVVTPCEISPFTTSCITWTRFQLSKKFPFTTSWGGSTFMTARNSWKFSHEQFCIVEFSSRTISHQLQSLHTVFTLSRNLSMFATHFESFEIELRVRGKF